MDTVMIVFLALLFVFGIPLVIMFLIYYYTEVRKPIELAKLRHANDADPTSEHHVVVKEVVMLPCPYCGGLAPQTSTYCPTCGAPRKLPREPARRPTQQ
jgi:hypothetical protein